jgi:hypothetical protein
MLEAHGLGQQILTALNSKPIYRGLVRYSGSVVGARSLIHIRNCHHILKSQLLSVGIFFAYSPSETALSLASVHLPHPPFWVAFPVIFSLCSLFLIRVLASVRDHVCI